MLKAMVAIAAMLSGGVTLGVAVHILNQPGAFTTPQPLLGGGDYLKRDVQSAIGAIEETPSVGAGDELSLPEVTIRPGPDPRPRTPTNRAPVPMTRPCSDWWELGPNASVRMLCR
jgi:hypothetical protein